MKEEELLALWVKIGLMAPVKNGCLCSVRKKPRAVEREVFCKEGLKRL